MRLLANENFPRIAVEALRARGHDVAWVRTDIPGASDQDVIHRAVAENRVLVTFDKDFGELAFRLVPIRITQQRETRSSRRRSA